MVILKAIGGVFVRIGRWIKNTAWVQPLLIVGGIFAIIFSIPYITKWVGSWFTSGSDAENYYQAHAVDLTGAEEGNSDVDALFDYIADPTNADNAKAKAKYGDKFFLALVQKSCSSCEDRYPGFETLQDNWGTGEFANVDGQFKLFTIYVDEKNSDDESLFEKVYNRPDVEEIFEKAIENMQDQYLHPYSVNNSSGASTYASDLENLIVPEEITTPTTFLFDFSENAPAWTSENGIREVLFSFESTGGSDDYAKARTLRNAWTNDWQQSSKDGLDNIFSPYYKKA